MALHRCHIGLTVPSWGFGYNAASQISSETRDNDAYKFGGLATVTRPYQVNGLNQYSSVGSAVYCYDANGNLTADGTSVYKYDIENRLVERRALQSTACPTTTSGYGGALQAALTYDPLGRLYQTDKGTSATTTRFLYDGDALALEYNSSNAVLDRYVHGGNAAADDPLVWYQGSNLNNPSWLHADHLGSIVGWTDSSGKNAGVNSYDEYGIPGSTNSTALRFGYTGQAWIPELGMYYYKARIYSQNLGRFMQTDPIGYEGGVNLYRYVGDDPINGTDPSGLCTQAASAGKDTRPTQICKPASALNTSSQGRRFIQTSEGRKDRVYKDSGGLPTVGVGHLVTKTDNLKINDRVSGDKIDNFFSKDLTGAEKVVERLVRSLPVSQEEFDALTDLAFNVGPAKLSTKSSPGLNNAIKAGDYARMGEQIRYTRDASGRSPPGLIHRNDVRQDIFLNGDYGP